MRKLFLFIMLAMIASSLTAQPVTESDDVLTVYSYDSFSGTWGPAGSLIPAFEEKTGIKVNLVGAGDAESHALPTWYWASPMISHTAPMST